MGRDGKLTELELRIEQQFGLRRGVLLAVGLGCVALGLVSAFLPLKLYRSLIKLVAGLLFGSAAIKAFQLIPGRAEANTRRRSWPAVLCQIALDVAMGVLLVQQWETSIVVLTILLGLMFAAEGLVLLYMALRAPSARSRTLLVLCGLAAIGIGLAEIFGWVSDPLAWAGVFVGIKLINFGGSLAWIGWKALRSDTALLYEAEPLVPEVGELYAVYFGTAFHLGVYIGSGEVVHYLNDNHVYRVPWSEFLADRVPSHWVYPDLPPVPVETVIRTALAEVGNMYPYNLLTFNCEHFAVYCKSGGTTRVSRYAQVASGVTSVADHPIRGLIAEINTRAVEWLAYQVGGAYGKTLSLKIRRLGAAVTTWLLAPAKQGE